MKRYPVVASVLFSLALPAAGICADAPKAEPKPNHPALEAPKESAQGGHSAKPPVASQPPKVEEVTSGKVIQTMEGGGYTYALLENKKKKTWVAYSTRQTSVGDTLSFKACMEMQNFQSKALNRTFESIMFCNEPDQQVKAGPKLGTKSPGPVSAGATKIKVDKATGAGAYTVAEIFSKSMALHGKKVSVRGQVVKVSQNIMDRNWIHLQDGTGDEKKKTHDLVITSKELPSVGDVVTITGSVFRGKDYGGGYKYPVVLEQGVIKKEAKKK